MIAERVPHERRHEGAQERSGDAGEETAQADDQQRNVRDPRRANRLHWRGRHDLGRGTRLHPRASIDDAHLILAGRAEPFLHIVVGNRVLGANEHPRDGTEGGSIARRN